MLLVTLDVDGTLESAGGPISGDLIRQKLDRPEVRWGILSSRSVERSSEACRSLGVAPAFVRVCRVDMRAEELNQIREEFPGFDQYVYVADRSIDRAEALRAGWTFCWAHAFERWGQCG